MLLCSRWEKFSRMNNVNGLHGLVMWTNVRLGTYTPMKTWKFRGKMWFSFSTEKIFPGLTQPWIPDYLLESRIFFLKLFVTYFQKLEVWIGIHLLFLTTFKNGPKLRENLLKTSPSNHFLKICSSKILLFCYVVSPRRIIIPFKYEKDEAFLKNCRQNPL